MACTHTSAHPSFVDRSELATYFSDSSNRKIHFYFHPGLKISFRKSSNAPPSNVSAGRNTIRWYPLDKFRVPTWVVLNVSHEPVFPTFPPIFSEPTSMTNSFPAS